VEKGVSGFDVHEIGHNGMTEVKEPIPKINIPSQIKGETDTHRVRTKSGYLHNSHIIPLQDRFYQPLHGRVRRPDPHDLQPRRPEQLGPLGLCALRRCNQGHHEPVEGGDLPIGAAVRDDVFVDEKLGIALLHGLRDLLQDASAIGVRPVVEDGMQEIGSCS